jgi:hypothetical protein
MPWEMIADSEERKPTVLVTTIGETGVLIRTVFEPFKMTHTAIIAFFNQSADNEN